MDIEKLIERLRNAAGGPEGIKMCQDAATALSTLQAEVKRMKSLLCERGQDLWSKENQRADRLHVESEKLRMENIRRWRQVASEQDKQLDKLRAELEQVKHQRDSYRLYHDDLVSKPNCNTCADKDCKYRPIPGDTVRANCPLWRGPEEG